MSVTVRASKSRRRTSRRGQPRTATVRAQPSGERGSSAVETAIVITALLVVVFLVLQVVLWFMAQHSAAAAADAGAFTAAEQTSAAGRNKAAGVVADLGFVREPAVRASRTGDTATVTVTGSTLSLVPGLRLTVRKVGVAAVERTTTP